MRYREFYLLLFIHKKQYLITLNIAIILSISNSSLQLQVKIYPAYKTSKKMELVFVCSLSPGYSMTCKHTRLCCMIMRYSDIISVLRCIKDWDSHFAGNLCVMFEVSYLPKCMCD